VEIIQNSALLHGIHVELAAAFLGLNADRVLGTMNEVIV